MSDSPAPEPIRFQVRYYTVDINDGYSDIQTVDLPKDPTVDITYLYLVKQVVPFDDPYIVAVSYKDGVITLHAAERNLA